MALFVLPHQADDRGSIFTPPFLNYGHQVEAVLNHSL